MNRIKRFLCCLLCCGLFALYPVPDAAAAERDADAAMAAAQGHSDDEDLPPRPAKLPDLTKGEVIPPAPKVGVRSWNLGPTGIVGTPNAWYDGDQVQVLAVLPGSPADGKILPGDVVMGFGGKDFAAGGHLGIEIGNAIIQAETEAGQGKLQIRLWRDRNWTKRGAPKDMLGVDLDDLIAETEEAQLYEWEGEEERNVAIKNQGYDDFPIDGVRTNVMLQLAVMGTYGGSSPWKCPVADQIRENALKVIAEEFRPSQDRRIRKKPDWPGVLALVASGKPEYVALAKSWVHTQKVTHDMNLETSLDDMSYRGYQSWRTGFEALEQALYYDATGDEFILPEIRKRAIWAALGQNGGGSWGHTFAFPEFNGGELHQRNPGYGAMNNAGTRCFFLLALAREKFGIQHPEIDLAIDRASRFFRTYVDKGVIPYGYHAPALSDDSNGKNYGATYAFHVLGKEYEAKYFAMHSAHASFSRRGGHGSPTLWYYTPLSGSLAGPKGVIAAMRNMRWFYTLARRHDGSFVFQGQQAGMGGKGMRNPTATHAIYYSFPLRQLIITGKDVDQSRWFTDEEFGELMMSARAQITDPLLLKGIGIPWNERSTDELIAWLDHFIVGKRRDVAKELGKRYAAGERDILTKVLPLLASREARAREGACLTLQACGTDAVLSNLSKVTALLDDPAEFVRMTAIQVVAASTEPANKGTQLRFLQAALDEYDGMTMDIANVRRVARDVLFPERKKGETIPSLFATDPFKQGFDYDLLRGALENIVTLDPGGIVPSGWSKETVVRLAGPIVHVAAERQLNDAMFAGARTAAAQSILEKYGYAELLEADSDILRKRIHLERDLREQVEFLHRRLLNGGSYITLSRLRANPAAYKDVLAAMQQWLQDDPLTVLQQISPANKNVTESVWLGALIPLVENAGAPKPMPYLRREVQEFFSSELNRLGGTSDQIKHCRTILANPKQKDYFRKLAAMQHLYELLSVDAFADLAPYLGHDHWRLREEAHKMAVELVRSGGVEVIVSMLSQAQSKKNLSAMLLVLKDAGDRRGLQAVAQAMKHPDGSIRKVALQALATLGGERALPMLWSFMESTPTPDDLWGCELALLSLVDDANMRMRVQDGAIERMAKGSIPMRRSLAWVLAQIGGSQNLAALQSAASQSDDAKDIRNIVKALSYSPDRAADGVLLALAKSGRMQLDAVAAEAVRRMVGPNGASDVTDRQRVDFARAILDLKLDNRLVQFLGNVHTGRAIQLLFEVMQKTDRTEMAAKSIIAAAEGMENPPPDEGKIAADALAQVIEYIEVTRLRGGMQAHMRKEDNYLGWKDIQARAGKALLKVHKPEKAPVPTFDDMQLDF